MAFEQPLAATSSHSLLHPPQSHRPRRIRDVLARRAPTRFLGRREELAFLSRLLYEDDHGPSDIVVHVHGLAGIGKSSLLEAFSSQARARGASIVHLDCRGTEPTERGFLYELRLAIGSSDLTPDGVAERLGDLGSRVILTMDNYEVFYLMDTWLRQTFIPALPENVRVILCGREPPHAGWLVSAEWSGLFRGIALAPLDEPEAVEMLAGAGIREEQAHRINQVARGHPLALKLAAAAVSEHLNAGLEEAAVQRVVDDLAQRYLVEVDDLRLRRAIEAVSIARRVTHSLLRAMLPDDAPYELFEQLRALPFVESGPDGLVLHEAVRTAIAAMLRSQDPSGHREYRQSAWRQLRAEARTAGIPELWRYTADLLYLIENAIVREAFFPSAARPYYVEPARSPDGAAIQRIGRRHEGPSAAVILDEWWACTPKAFSVVRGRAGDVTGFYCMFEPDAVDSDRLRVDPLTRTWWEHLQRHPVPQGQRVLFLRRWLGLESGESPSPVQAACWLDIKRSYMALRPHLRRVYLAVQDLPTYAPVALQLGFQPLTEAAVELDRVTYHTAMLDFGPSSVDGWLAGLIAAEIGVANDSLLDVDARELVLGGQRISLTPLEFGVMYLLWQNEGRVVTRTSLLDGVWHSDYEGGSNVVDVVVGSLRKKLGDRATSIETVRGAGYRFRES